MSGSLLAFENTLLLFMPWFFPWPYKILIVSASNMFSVLEKKYHQMTTYPQLFQYFPQALIVKFYFTKDSLLRITTWDILRFQTSVCRKVWNFKLGGKIYWMSSKKYCEWRHRKPESSGAITSGVLGWNTRQQSQKPGLLKFSVSAPDIFILKAELLGLVQLRVVISSFHWKKYLRPVPSPIKTKTHTQICDLTWPKSGRHVPEWSNQAEIFWVEIDLFGLPRSLSFQASETKGTKHLFQIQVMCDFWLGEAHTQKGEPIKFESETGSDFRFFISEESEPGSRF